MLLESFHPASILLKTLLFSLIHRLKRSNTDLVAGNPHCHHHQCVQKPRYCGLPVGFPIFRPWSLWGSGVRMSHLQPPVAVTPPKGNPVLACVSEPAKNSSTPNRIGFTDTWTGRTATGSGTSLMLTLHQKADFSVVDVGFGFQPTHTSLHLADSGFVVVQI